MRTVSHCLGHRTIWISLRENELQLRQTLIACGRQHFAVRSAPNRCKLQGGAPDVDGKVYNLEISGLVENKKPWTLDELHALPQVSQITRHIFVEGWSAIGSWQGTPLSEFLQ